MKIETVETGTARAQLLRQPDTAFGTVIQNYALTSPGAPVKRHIGMLRTVHDYQSTLAHPGCRICSAGRFDVSSWGLPCHVRSAKFVYGIRLTFIVQQTPCKPSTGCPPCYSTFRAYCRTRGEYKTLSVQRSKNSDVLINPLYHSRSQSTPPAQVHSPSTNPSPYSPS